MKKKALIFGFGSIGAKHANLLRRVKKISEIRFFSNRTKTELLIELRKIGIDTTVKRFLKSELIVLAIENNVPISISENVVIKGWVNAPKGMLQILWERGFIDDTQVKISRSSRYSKDGRKDDVDAVMIATIAVMIMHMRHH